MFDESSEYLIHWHTTVDEADRNLIGEVALSVARDSSSNVYVTGYTVGALTGNSAGSYDIFVTKCNSSGTQQWIRQISTSSGEKGSGVAVDSSRIAYVTGYTSGALIGTNAGGDDVFLLKYDTNGNQQ